MDFQRIDMNDPTPKYYQVYKCIKSGFSDGQLVPDEVLPSESELMDQFGVSRVTIRKAMDKLEQEGYIQRKPGYGTVVLDYQHIFRAARSANLSTVLPGVKSTDIQLEVVDPPKKIQILLCLEPGEKVYKLTRTRTYEGVKVVYGSSFLIMRDPIKLTRDMFDENTSLYAVLERLGVTIDDCDETIEARIPDSEMKKRLDISDEDALFYRERVTFDKSGRPFEFDVSYYNAAKIKYTISSGTYSHVTMQ